MAINIFKISKAWFDLSFEDYRITPTHTTLIFYMIDLNNRLSWVDTFGLPAFETCQALNISYNTFRKVLKELIDFGHIWMVTKSTNQHTANIISLNPLYQNLLKQDKSKHKATLKQVQKQSDIIKPIKPLNLKTINFDIFWNLYDYKKDRKKSKSKWDKLKLKTQQKIIDSIPEYKKATPDKQFRKYPSTYLNNESWNDEVFIKKTIEAQYAAHYEENKSNKSLGRYAFLLKQKKDVLYKFNDIITLDEFSKLKINGNLENVIISFQNYGKTKDEFLTNLGIHVRKY